MQPSATLDQLLAERLRVLARVDPTANNAPISAADLRVLTTASLADDLAAGRALCGALRGSGRP